MVNPEELENLLTNVEANWLKEKEIVVKPIDKVIDSINASSSTYTIEANLGTRDNCRMYVFVHIPANGSPMEMTAWKQSFTCDNRTSVKTGFRQWSETMALPGGTIIKVFGSDGASNDADYFEVNPAYKVIITNPTLPGLLVSGNLRKIEDHEYAGLQLPNLRHRSDFRLQVDNV